MEFLFSATIVRCVPSFTILLLFLLSSWGCFTSTEAYDPLDPNGNITIKWDIMSWTPDGYVAVVTLYNFQKFRHIQPPGWRLGWTWARDEVIWSLMGSQTTEQGDCSRFKGNIPHSCKKSPTVVDLLPETPFNQQVENCCKGGVLSSWVQDPAAAVASFQLSVGAAGNSDTTVKLPKNFTLKAPGPGYTCGPAKVVQPSKFITKDKRRITQAMMTWNVTCTFSQFLAHKAPACCVSMSSFLRTTITPCATCACGCRNATCVDPKNPSDVAKQKYAPLVQCTSHMCPVRVHWHVKANYKHYCRVKITIMNLIYNMNYTGWNLVLQHPSSLNLAQILGFSYKSLSLSAKNDTAMLWGLESYNDQLFQAGPLGNVEAELLFRKDPSATALKTGSLAFPRRVYFDGDSCAMPAFPHTNP